MSNFDFLYKNETLKTVADTCVEAEKGLTTSNVTCAILTRRALENAVKWIYDNDDDLEMPYQDNLSALIYENDFRYMLDQNIFSEIIYIVKLGNLSVHTNRKIDRSRAVLGLKYLFDFMKWITYTYKLNYQEDIKFDLNVLPPENIDFISKEDRINLENELAQKDEYIQKILKQTEELRKKLTEARKNNENVTRFKVDDLTEFDTRKQFINIDLELAGWDFSKNIEIEFPVIGMPNESGVGSVDYVLMGEDKTPIAVVEAKKTSRNPKEGKQQGKIYADCIEKMCGKRPVIYYTNGKEIWMWDDFEYPERRVSGYYTQKELQQLINRRTQKGNLNYVTANRDIAGRYYQIEALKHVCESFQEKRRRALLVMATGTGKTRTAISIVNTLLEKGWVKNILFLADRTTLVSQAMGSFKKFLPDLSCCNLLEHKTSPEDSRAIFSTYQTMINCIDSLKDKDNQILFTPGHFDLIIIDEAHRSIYKKYQEIFEYFDGLMLGMTATPRSDIDKNTYEFFELENNIPTYYYDYEKAVEEHFLVPYHTIKTDTKFIREGIKYNELSNEEKEEYENLFDEGDAPESIGASAINEWLFNEDTIKQELVTLMDRGLKVEGGDKLAKSIIFARNHAHAEKIEEVFDKLYPYYKGEFAQVIDNKMKSPSDAIDKFEDENSYPQIAISVDMLDTGVDVPEVANLMFFKPVKSKIKFWQMIGRGTRLCPNLFGEGKDKTQFYIFDCCGNFEFFNENQNGLEPPDSQSLTERIFTCKLDFIREFENMKYQEIPEYKSYRESLVNEFLNQINNFDKDSFRIRTKRALVDKYSNIEVWQHINDLNYEEIKDSLISLFYIDDNDEWAKRFDNIIYSLQIRKILNKNYKVQINYITSFMDELMKLGTIPLVQAKRDYIIKASNEINIERMGFFELEELRQELRDLIKLIDHNGKQKVITHFVDIIDVVDTDDGIEVSPIVDPTNYYKKVKNYLKGNLESLVIHKIRTNQKLTELDKEQLEEILYNQLGTSEDYRQTFGNENIITTVRKLVGLDQNTANEIFAKYINDNRLNSKQIEFVKELIKYVSANGVVERKELMEEPFKSFGSVSEVFEGNIVAIQQILTDIDNINNNAKDIA